LEQSGPGTIALQFHYKTYVYFIKGPQFHRFYITISRFIYLC